MREKIPRDEVPRGREGGGAERGNSLDGIDHSTFRMETTERRRLWNSFSLNWALKAVKESCCRLPSLAGSCQMNPGMQGNEWQRDMHEFWHGYPCPDFAVCRVGTWEVEVFASPRSELESASVDRAVMPLF